VLYSGQCVVQWSAAGYTGIFLSETEAQCFLIRIRARHRDMFRTRSTGEIQQRRIKCTIIIMRALFTSSRVNSILWKTTRLILLG